MSKENLALLSPEIEHYLDELREEGSINMLAAAPQIASHFDMPIEEAKQVLLAWIWAYKGKR